ncbi:hypothetical protein D3C72_1543040 [compost metagenome]
MFFLLQQRPGRVPVEPRTGRPEHRLGEGQRARGGTGLLDDPFDPQGVGLRLTGAGEPFVLLPGRGLHAAGAGRVGHLSHRQALPVRFLRQHAPVHLRYLPGSVPGALPGASRRTVENRRRVTIAALADPHPVRAYPGFLRETGESGRGGLRGRCLRTAREHHLRPDWRAPRQRP